MVPGLTPQRSASSFILSMPAVWGSGTRSGPGAGAGAGTGSGTAACITP